MNKPKYFFNQSVEIESLNKFFQSERSSITSFGSTVNQVFEAHMFARVIKWYQDKGWHLTYRHPDPFSSKRYLRLKFSTRGKPGNYSYVIARKGSSVIQIHHQLRVSTRSYKANQAHRANICCDVAIINETEGIEFYLTDDAVPNSSLLSFGEAKHMSAFAELIAGFIGMVHELKPEKLRRVRIKGYTNDHLSPFMYASGIMYTTAKGLEESIRRRKYDVDIYSFDKKL